MLVARFRSPEDARAAIETTAGAFIGVERGVGMSESWEQTFEPRTHTMPVEVHATSTEEMATARRALEQHRPLALHEASGAGR
jgi:hypothetical protein